MSRKQKLMAALALGTLFLLGALPPSTAKAADVCDNCYEYLDEIEMWVDAQCCFVDFDPFLCGIPSEHTLVDESVHCNLQRVGLGWQCDPSVLTCDEDGDGGGSSGGGCSYQAGGWCPPECASCS